MCTAFEHPKFSYGSFTDRSHPQLFATNSESSCATIATEVSSVAATELYSMAFAVNDFRLAQM